MRTVNQPLVSKYAEELRPLLPVAARAYGTQAPDSEPRLASLQVNELLAEYADEHGGNLTHLANALEGSISLPGLRRRLRAARSGNKLAVIPRDGRGTTDPEEVARWAKTIGEARQVSPREYGKAVREAYAAGVSLSAIAKQLDVQYFSLWVAGSHN